MLKNPRNRIFIYQNKPYMRITPTKRLFNSTTIYEVITRGDLFAVDLQTGIFTVLPKDCDTAIVKENG